MRADDGPVGSERRRSGPAREQAVLTRSEERAFDRAVRELEGSPSAGPRGRSPWSALLTLNAPTLALLTWLRLRPISILLIPIGTVGMVATIGASVVAAAAWSLVFAVGLVGLLLELRDRLSGRPPFTRAG
jgi:hypothetical protein